jgi:hypothetical protein
LTEFHQYGALGLRQPSASKPDLSELIMAASISSRSHDLTLTTDVPATDVPGRPWRC